MTFRAVDDAEAKGADFVVCYRVADMPPISAFPPEVQAEVRENRANSTRQPCEGCGHAIMVSPQAPAGIPRICTVCNQDVRKIAARAAGRPS